MKRLLTLPKLNIFCIIYRTIHGFLRKRLKSKKASKYQQRIQTETNESMLSVLVNNLQSIVKKEKPPIILNDYIRIEDGMIKYPENGNEEDSGKKRKASGMYTYLCLFGKKVDSCQSSALKFNFFSWRGERLFLHYFFPIFTASYILSSSEQVIHWA